MTTRSMTPRQVRSSVIAVVAGGAAALALLAAIGTREIATNSDGTNVPVATEVGVQSDTGAVPQRSVRPAPVFLIVASEEQAAIERARWIALDNATRPLGEAEQEFVALVVENDAQAAQLQRGIDDMNVLREAEGLSVSVVLDRRGDPGASTR